MKTGLKRAARILLAVGVAVGACSVVGQTSAAVRVPELMGAYRAAKAIPDDMFLQEVGMQVPSAEPLLSVAFRGRGSITFTAR